MDQFQGSLFAKDQYRMSRLQVFNWGTFSALHDIPISEKGFLIVGRSGTGRTTLLDALSALLVPPRSVNFNAAARETDRGGRDRNLVSYIRGAWAEQMDGESGDYVKRYLRTGTTWSALALSYKNSGGQVVTLAQIFSLRGSASGSQDVKRHYMVFDRNFNLRELEDFGQSNFDMRKLKQSFPNIFSRDEFPPYREHFCRLLGIEGELALKLLHKTQSAKNLGDLNIFLREFMLDEPETFQAADDLVNEFGELNAAHQAVVTARQQIETLIPAREKYGEMGSLNTWFNSLRELLAGEDIYVKTRRMDLLKESAEALAVEAEGQEGER
ncbi:MAG: AAA family ATPase, partial [Treponema sp.]|nr:AAA family ATPase [Treponema sp.]